MSWLVNSTVPPPTARLWILALHFSWKPASPTASTSSTSMIPQRPQRLGQAAGDRRGPQQAPQALREGARVAQLVDGVELAESADLDGGYAHTTSAKRPSWRRKNHNPETSSSAATAQDTATMLAGGGWPPAKAQRLVSTTTTMGLRAETWA